MSKIRLDQYLCQNGLVQSREPPKEHKKKFYI